MVFDNKSFEDAKPLRFAGNLRLIVDILLSYLEDIYQGNIVTPITLFGYPGGGKSTIIDAVFNEIKERHPELAGGGQVLTINGSLLISQFATERLAVTAMNENLQPFLESSNGLSVIIADETDALAPGRGVYINPLFTHAMMGLIKNSPAVAWLVVTNYPELIDPAVLSRTSPVLHVPTPDQSATAAILETHLESSVALEVAEYLFKNDLYCAITIRGLDSGLKLLDRYGYISGRQLVDVDPKIASRYILGCGGGAFPSKQNLNSYLFERREMISLSDAFCEMYIGQQGRNYGS